MFQYIVRHASHQFFFKKKVVNERINNKKTITANYVHGRSTMTRYLLCVVFNYLRENRSISSYQIPDCSVLKKKIECI